MSDRTPREASQWPGEPGVPLDPNQDGLHRLRNRRTGEEATFEYLVTDEVKGRAFWRHLGLTVPANMAYWWNYVRPAGTSL